jgi:CxxC motif-containing protein (DUF1111 family)
VKKLLVVSALLCLGALHRSAVTEPVPASADKIPLHMSYLQPLPDLNPEQRQKFRDGEKVFNTFWIAVPNDVMASWWNLSEPGPGGAEWGLGPTFTATSCVACHIQAGRGHAMESSGGKSVFQQSLRLSIPGTDAHGGPKPDPNYGLHVQPFDTINSKDTDRRAGEAEVHVDWKNSRFTLADGEVVELRKPAIRLEQLNFGPLADGVMMSLRNTQAIYGLGYLEAVSEQDILALAALQKAQGLNGRPNYVRDDVNDKTSIGRFGWKANQPSLRQQIAGAFLGDIGVSSPLYPEQNCPPVQKDCQEQRHHTKPDLRPELWDRITFWATALNAPSQRERDNPAVQRGEKLFAAAKCAQCHVPELKTGSYDALPQLGNKTIRPYTDLLLHDMGPELADGRPDYKAGGSDWRTSPLWGIGLSKNVNGSTNFLHDGRARNLQEAIVWHGGEAQASRDLFAKLSRKERDDLLAFLQSL